MPLLGNSKFDGDPIKMNVIAWRHHFPIIILMAFLDLTPKGVVRSGRNSKLSETLCLSSLPTNLTNIGSKLKVLSWRHLFPHYVSGSFLFPWQLHLMESAPKAAFPHATDDTYRI